MGRCRTSDGAQLGPGGENHELPRAASAEGVGDGARRTGPGQAERDRPQLPHLRAAAEVPLVSGPRQAAQAAAVYREEGGQPVSQGYTLEAPAHGRVRADGGHVRHHAAI